MGVKVLKHILLFVKQGCHYLSVHMAKGVSRKKGKKMSTWFLIDQGRWFLMLKGAHCAPTF